MKLCRYGNPGEERPGVIDADGNIRDLHAYIADVDARALSPQTLSDLSTIDPATLPLVTGSPRYGPCVAGTRQFVAIGLNYVDHAHESNLPIPEEPVVFNKWVSCIQGPNDPVRIPKDSKKTDWEVELGIVIGTEAHNVSEADALDHVAGYCVVHDVSERAFQMDRGGTWDKGKGCDTFGPTGPWLVTADEVGDPQNLRLWLEVDGKRYQDSSTADMIFTVAELVSYVSQFCTLEPGVIISTGTPEGVGLGQKPPVYLRAGQTVKLGVEKLGEQTQRMVAAG